MDVCLIPEVPFVLHGQNGLCAYLEKVLESRGHAVVCLAEGAGQVQHITSPRGCVLRYAFIATSLCSIAEDLQNAQSAGIFPCLEGNIESVEMLQDILAKGELGTDASGNPILQDVGVWMKGELKSHFKEADIKYIEPSYMIRSTPTISSDRIYCKVRPSSNLSVCAHQASRTCIHIR